MAQQQDLMRPLTSNRQYSELWQRVLAKLRFQYGEATFNSWFKQLTLKSLEDNCACVEAPTRFIREWVNTHYHQDIFTHLKSECDELVLLDMRTSSSATTSTDTPATQEHETAARQLYNYNTPIAKSNADSSGYVLEDISSELDPRYTFQSFVTGSSNELAHAAARSVAESESVIPGSNPLFLYGGVGLGKTHLMHAIAWYIREHQPHRKVLYLSAEKFMYQFIRALRNKDIVSFKEFFRSVDVLMIDDVQFICGKNSTQEEFFHTFNALIDNNRQLVLSGDRSPSDLSDMEERIRSRLGWGLVADINQTTYELRLGILQSKVERMKTDVPDNVLEFLAAKINSNTRELEGALNRVVAHCNLIKHKITLDGVQHILRDLLRTNQTPITIHDIQKCVAEYCNVRISDMHSARRAQHIARPRQIAMYLSKKLTSHSLPEIGRKFGGKDHTTVMHAVRRVESLCHDDPEIRRSVEMLMGSLEQR